MKNGYRIYDKKSATPPAKDVLEQVEAHYQFIPNALGAMAESPEAVKAYLALDELAHENALNDLQRHVVFLTIAREYECSYCVAAHTAFAQMGRVEGEIVQRLREGVALADPALQALHDFTQQLIRTAGHVSEKDVQAFLDAGYSHRQILDIITMIANKLIAVFANRVMGTDLDEALKPAEWRKIA
jgi:uncharacterized peroxidase-related enzyme